MNTPSEDQNAVTRNNRARIVVRAGEMDEDLEGGEQRMLLGKYKGMTYRQIVIQNPQYVARGLSQKKPSQVLQSFLSWVMKHYVVEGSTLTKRSLLAVLPGTYNPMEKPSSSRKPPNPPLEKCVECKYFSHQGSTGYTVRKDHDETGRQTNSFC